ncbi:MAG: nucleotidyl transferase AbiEii/AbiGii toxin family protein [Solirubrobacteraceae bacterium]
MSSRTHNQAYLDLQKLAREQGRNTQQLFELYIHERFLARLAASSFAERFVLKGGMLLAVLNVRRTTRDADMLARGLSNDANNLRAVIGEIAAIPMDDGVSFDPTTISVESIREDADYEGVRLTLPVDLGGAKLKLRLDLSFGDPIHPQHIDYPTLLDDPDFRLLGYPLESVIAEKADTMMLLADANTRDRDYGDVYLLSGIHQIEAQTLREALRSVTEHRNHEIRPLGEMLETLRERRQQPWERFRARSGLASLPERFSDVVDCVVGFIDGVHDENISRWNPTERRWK